MWDPVWETTFTSQAWGKYPAEALIRFVARNYYGAKNRKNVRFLELGCGPGANLWFLAREGFSFFGIDGSETAIKQAAERLDMEFPGWQGYGELVVADITKFEFQNDMFDAVIDSECVCCLPLEDSVRIYSAANRALINNGNIFVRTFSTETWGYGSGKKVAENTYICDEGPLCGKGASRFTTFDQIPQLLGDFIELQTEKLTQTCGNQSKAIVEWIITGKSGTH